MSRYCNYFIKRPVFSTSLLLSSPRGRNTVQRTTCCYFSSKSIELHKNGYLYETTNAKLPLLASTERLLDHLGYRNNDVPSPARDDDSSSSSPASKPNRVQCQNFLAYFATAFDDILHLDDDSSVQPQSQEGHTESWSKKQKYNITIHEQLEKQRERLHQKQKSNHDYHDQTESSNLVQTQEKKNAWLILARTLNSIRVLTPIALQVIFHEQQQNDKELSMIGNNPGSVLPVHDKSTAKSKMKLQQQLAETLCDIGGFFGIPATHLQAAHATEWNEPIGKCMQVIHDYHHKGSSSSSSSSSMCAAPWFDFDVLDGFTEAEKEEAKERAKQIDIKFDLNVQRNQEKHQRRYTKAMKKLRKKVSECLSHQFTDCRVTIYGSCLTGLSLGQNTDVDLCLFIEENAEIKKKFEAGEISVNGYRKRLAETLYQVQSALLSFEEGRSFRKVQAITRPKIPLVKGTFTSAGNPYSNDGSLKFDISISNERAVANSFLLKEYTLIDGRVKSLLIAVKTWAKRKGISSAREASLSSYTWNNLVLFYLQCLGFIPNLQSEELMQEAGVEYDENEYWHNVDNLRTCFVKAGKAKKVWKQAAYLENASVVSLLYGFFRFYSNIFPSTIFMASIKRGKETLLPKTLFASCGLFMTIEDPFETYDSHMPKDLSIPVLRAGRKRSTEITKAIRDEASHLKRILKGEKPVDSFKLLWRRVGRGGRGKHGRGESDRKGAGTTTESPL